MRWVGISNINTTVKPPSGSGGGGRGGISIEEAKGLLSDDLVFKIFAPIENGIQEETELLYPYHGVITNVYISIPIGSVIKSNYNIILQRYNKINNQWDNILTTWMQTGEYEKVVNVNNYEINNERLRISVPEGDLNTLDGITIICKMKEPINID